jgi:YfiH family protein
MRLNPVDLFRFTSLAAIPWLNHGISTRHGGVSPAPYASLNVGRGPADDPANVETNRSILFRAFDLDPKSVIYGRLTHGNAVTVAASSGESQHPGWFGSDALVTDLPGLYPFLTFADCVPLMVVDPVRRVLGVAHAGWRGTAAGIASNLISACVAFGSSPADLLAGIGPSIGPCCYTVGTEVDEAFARAGSVPVWKTDRENNPTLDLWETNRRQLREQGVRDEAIEVSALCTACNVDRFYSYRREGGRTGRFALVAGLA